MADVMVLTDDEVVGLAVERGSPWPGGTPTVVDTDEAVGAAAFRGDRSLVVRGLRTSEGPPISELASMLEAIAEAAAHIEVYLADGQYSRTSWGLASTHHVAAGDWLFETTNSLGVHRLAWHAPPEHLGYVSALLDSAVDNGPDRHSPSEDSPEWLCVLAENDDKGLLFAARRGELQMIRLDHRQDPAEAPAADIGSGDDCVHELGALLGSAAR